MASTMHACREGIPREPRAADAFAPRAQSADLVDARPGALCRRAVARRRARRRARGELGVRGPGSRRRVSAVRADHLPGQ